MIAAEEITRWDPLCRAICSHYHLLGGDREDLLQEARIGVWHVLRDYRPERGSLRTFVGLCVERQVITAVKTATRAKHKPLSYAERAYVTDEGEEVEIVSLIADPSPGADEVLDIRARLKRLIRALRRDLTYLERSCITGRANGQRHDEIAASLGVRPKAVDNALVRAKRKLAEAA